MAPLWELCSDSAHLNGVNDLHSGGDFDTSGLVHGRIQFDQEEPVGVTTQQQPLKVDKVKGLNVSRAEKRTVNQGNSYRYSQDGMNPRYRGRKNKELHNLSREITILGTASEPGAAHRDMKSTREFNVKFPRKAVQDRKSSGTEERYRDRSKCLKNNRDGYSLSRAQVEGNITEPSGCEVFGRQQNGHIHSSREFCGKKRQKQMPNSIARLRKREPDEELTMFCRRDVNRNGQVSRPVKDHITRSKLRSTLTSASGQPSNTNEEKIKRGVSFDDASNNRFFACFSGNEEPQKTEERFYGGLRSERLAKQDIGNVLQSEYPRPFQSPSPTTTTPPVTSRHDLHQDLHQDLHRERHRDLYHEPLREWHHDRHHWQPLNDAEVLGVSTNDPRTGETLLARRPLPYGKFRTVSLLLESQDKDRRDRELPVYVTPHDRPPLATRLQPYVPFETPQPSLASTFQTQADVAYGAGNAQGQGAVTVVWSNGRYKVVDEGGGEMSAVRHPPVQFKPNVEKDVKGPLQEPFHHPGIVWPLAFATRPPYTCPGHEASGVKQAVGVVQTGVVPARPLQARAWQLDTDIPAWVSPLYKTYGIGGPYGRHGPFVEPCLLSRGGVWDTVVRQAEALGALSIPGVITDGGRLDLSGMCTEYYRLKKKEEAEARKRQGWCQPKGPCAKVRNFFMSIRNKLGFRPKSAGIRIDMTNVERKTPVKPADDYLEISTLEVENLPKSADIDTERASLEGDIILNIAETDTDTERKSSEIKTLQELAETETETETDGNTSEIKSAETDGNTSEIKSAETDIHWDNIEVITSQTPIDNHTEQESFTLTTPPELVDIETEGRSMMANGNQDLHGGDDVFWEDLVKGRVSLGSSMTSLA